MIRIYSIHSTHHRRHRCSDTGRNNRERKSAGSRNVHICLVPNHRVGWLQLCGMSHLNDEQTSRLRADGGRLAGLQERHLLREVLEHKPVNQPRVDGQGLKGEDLCVLVWRRCHTAYIKRGARLANHSWTLVCGKL